MTAITPVTPDYTVDSGTAYPLNIDQGLASAQILANQFQPHESASGSPLAPDMTITIDAGVLYVGSVLTAKAQQITSASPADFIAPSSPNQRIDRVAIDMDTGDYVVITGTPGASPSAPAYSPNHYPLCQIALSDTTTQITNSLITNERPIIHKSLKPSFSVHRNGTDQENITSADKVEWTTKEFDTNSDFDATTNFRFTPTVEGKYLLSATIAWDGDTMADGNTIYLYLYKNGAVYKRHQDLVSFAAGIHSQTLTAVVDANGTTDYYEVFAEYTATNTADLYGNAERTYWTGCKID